MGNPIKGIKEKRSIVMLANGHSPFDTRIFIKEARSLIKAGFTVSIVVPHTNDDHRDGVKIIAVPPIRSGFWKLVVSPWNIFWKAIRQPAHSIFCIHDSDILCVGIVLKILRRKVIYDAHEDTPLQISYQHWLPDILKKPYAWFYYWLEKICGRMFDAIMVAEPVIAKYFPKDKTHLVRNFPLMEGFRSHPSIPFSKRESKMVYVGTLSKVRGLFQMLEGAQRAALNVNLEFVLGGQFAPLELEEEVMKNYSVNFLRWLPYEKLVPLLFESRIGIIIPNPIERYKTNYPVKMFEFMAAALPVIASKEGESASFIREANCGILVDPLNVEEISDAIIWLTTHVEEAEAMGKRGQELIFNKYNWETESKVLLSVLSGL
jgi:glycosyltransferase involved in cell wall biosynthesis